MVELIVAILVFTVIMAATTSVFAPMLEGFRRANNLAEANTLLDNLAAHMLADINSAVYVSSFGLASPSPIEGTPSLVPGAGAFTIRTPRIITYSINVNGHIMRDIPSCVLDTGPQPLFAEGFYRGAIGARVEEIEWSWEPSNGLVEVTITLSHADGWAHQRTYTTRPVGLAP
jgi:hypothetical protein